MKYLLVLQNTLWNLSQEITSSMKGCWIKQLSFITIARLSLYIVRNRFPLLWLVHYCYLCSTRDFSFQFDYPIRFDHFLSLFTFTFIPAMWKVTWCPPGRNWKQAKPVPNLWTVWPKPYGAYRVWLHYPLPFVSDWQYVRHDKKNNVCVCVCVWW